MINTTEFIGKRFHHLVVVGYGGTKDTTWGHRIHLWKCRCDCGKEILESKSRLNASERKSCGCQNNQGNKKHGYAVKYGEFHFHPIYISWSKMKERCLYPKHPHYDRYGGAGVKVCERWMKFENFLEDMKDGWNPGMSIDRFPNKNGNYEPGNCRWATELEQANNRTNNRRLTYKGRTQSLTAWARELKMARPTLDARISMGWSIEDAIERPIEVHRKAA